LKISPRYDGPVVVAIDDDPTGQLVPVTRQRKRFQEILAELTDQEWGHQSRCEAWTTRDVVAHLVSVTEFWNLSVAAGLAGEPTRWLAGFDPAATPPQLVDAMNALSTTEVLDRFVAANDALLVTLAGLAPEQWSMPAESPAGHVPIQLVAQHALWDSWIHERDVMIPLGLPLVEEPDEVISSLKFAAVVSPVLGIGVGQAEVAACQLGIEATDPSVQFIVEVDDRVTLRNDAPTPGVPCLRGAAAELTDVLTLRRPLDPSTPIEWREFLGGLEAAFDAV